MGAMGWVAGGSDIHAASLQHVLIPILVCIVVVPLIVLCSICAIKYANSVARRRLAEEECRLEVASHHRNVRFAELEMYTVTNMSRTPSMESRGCLRSNSGKAQKVEQL